MSNHHTNSNGESEPTSNNGHHMDNSSHKKKNNLFGNITSYVKQIPWGEMTSYFQQPNDVQYSVNENKDTVIGTQFTPIEIVTNDESKNVLSIQKKMYLILTYTNGFQVFDVNDPKRIQEIASVRGGPVRLATVLSPSNNPISYDENETIVSEEESLSFALSNDHPLLAVIFHDQPNLLKFYSLKNHAFVHEIAFKYEIYEVKSTPQVFVVMDERNVYWFHSATFKRLCSFPCYPSKNIDLHDVSDGKPKVHDYSGVIAIGKRWIAFPSDGSVSNKNLDMTMNSNQTYAEISLDVAKKAASGIYYLGDLGVKKVTNYLNPEKFPETTPKRKTPSYGSNAGTVEIRDLKTKKLMVQFKAHTEPISAMTFDPSGTLLITASVQGTHLNIYQIMPSSSGRIASKNIRHIYRLFRGLTTARLKDIQFSINSKWVAVSSTHGTTHVFAINPAGGPVDPRTHLPQSAQNRLVRDWQMNRRKKQEPDPLPVYVVDRIHNSSSFFLKNGANPASDVYTSKTTAAFFSPGTENENIFVCTHTGILNYYSLKPCLVENQPIDSSNVSKELSDTSPDEQILQMKIDSCGTWNLCRSKTHDIVTVPISWPKLEITSNNDISEEDDIKSLWISNVEIETYQAPSVPLWASGNFKFKTFETPDETEEDLYPEISEEDHSTIEQMSKSVYIRITDPVPYQSSSLIDEEHEAVPISNDVINKAIQTPMTLQRQKEESEKRNPSWELVHNDDSLMIMKEESIIESNMTRSILKSENSASKHKKNVRLSVETQTASEDKNIDQYFLNPSPTVTGISSQDVYLKKDVEKRSVSHSDQTSLLVPVQHIQKPQIDVPSLSITRETSPLSKIESISTSTPSSTSSSVASSPAVSPSMPNPVNDMGNSFMKLSFDNLNEDYFNRDKSADAQTPNGYHLSDSQDSSASSQGIYERVEEVNPFIAANAPAFIKQEDSDLDKQMQNLEGGDFDTDVESDSDDEVEIRRTPAVFEINTNFFSKDRPPIQQQNDSPQNEAMVGSILDMRFSDMEGSNFNFRSAYDNPNAATNEGGALDYDIDSDENEEEEFEM